MFCSIEDLQMTEDQLADAAPGGETEVEAVISSMSAYIAEVISGYSVGTEQKKSWCVSLARHALFFKAGRVPEEVQRAYEMAVSDLNRVRDGRSGFSAVSTPSITFPRAAAAGVARGYSSL